MTAVRRAACVFVCLMVMAPMALAEPNITVLVNGFPLNNDYSVIVSGGHVLVPARSIAMALGCSVQIKREPQSVTIYSLTSGIDFTLGKTTVITQSVKNGLGVSVIDAAPEIRGEQLYVPLRAAATYFGADVLWDSSTRTISVKRSSPTSSW